MSRKRNYKTPPLQPQKVVAEAKPSVDGIYAKILEQSADLSRKDIRKWRNALQTYFSNADSSSLLELQQIYQDLLMDGHISSQILLRKASILNTAYVALVDDAIDDDLTKLFNKSEWVYNLTDTMLDTIFTGTSAIEFQQVLEKDVIFAEIPKTNVNPKYKRIFLDANDLSKFIQYDQPAFQNTILQIGKDNHIGIINNIVVQLIWSRYAEQSWSEFCERFGLPMVTATSNKSNSAEIAKLEKKLSSLGESVSAVLPVGTTVDIKQPSNSDAYNVFKERINKCEDKISKQLLGGTMITDNGSSRSQSEVHERNLDDKISLMDARFINFNWTKILPLLKNRGFKIPENLEIKIDVSEKIDYTSLIDFIIKLLDKYDISIEWIQKTFGIPITSKKDVSKVTKDKVAKLNYTELQSFVNTLTNQYNIPKELIENSLGIPLDFNIPSVKNHAEAYHGSCNFCGGIVEDRFSANANNLLDKLRTYFVEYANKLFRGNLQDTDQAELTNQYQDIFSDGLSEHFDYANIDYDTEDAICRQAMELNLFQFSSAKTLSATLELNKALYNGDKKRTWADFKTQVDAIGNEYNVNWLQSEYNHTVAVGQNSSRWFKMWNEREDIPFWEYQTIGDSRVRDVHAILNGKVYRVEDKEAQRLRPPNGFGCRCEDIQHTGSKPIVSSGSEGVQLLKNQQKGNKDFLVNFSETKEVFNQNQRTLKNLTTGSVDALAKKFDVLSYKDYGLSENPTSPLELKLSNKTVEDVKKEFTEKRRLYKDYLGRIIKLTQKQFINHLEGKPKYLKENRHLLFEHIDSVLTTPDEVYLTGFAGKDTALKYIKHFKDRSIVVIGEYNAQNPDVFNLKTWFELTDNINRVGFLIKKGV